MACLGNPDPVDRKVYCPTGKETFDDETTEEAIGELAEASAQNPAFAKQHFVPQSPDIVAASTLMQPRAAQRVMLEVPTAPGVYPYVCTYPGHWRRMFGALYVVDDLEAYLADPAAYLAAHPLEIKDELLKDRRPRTEWTLADLQADLAGMEKGRSFIHGRELFRTSSCISCHKMGDAGNAFGPELAKLDAAMTPVEIARHILEPSLRIDEKYRSTTILTDDGQRQKAAVLRSAQDRRAVWDRRPLGSLGKQGEPIDSCTILTCDANKPMMAIHERMPVAIPCEQFARFLDPAEHYVE